MRSRAILFWVGLAAVLLVVGILVGRRGGEDRPLDPDSTGPLGTHGLVAFLEELGAEVNRGVPEDGTTDTALLLADQLGRDQRIALWDWIEDGGTLVVTDPNSFFAPSSGPSSVDQAGRISTGTCDVIRFRNRTLEASAFALYPSDRADRRCFGDGEESFLHVTERGDGLLIALGGALVFSNEQLDEADNAVLAAELLIGLDQDGITGSGGSSASGVGTTVTVLYDPVPDAAAEPRSVADLIPSGAKWAFWQLVAAVVIYALWRARRFGRPVTEPQPVALPGSLLVRAAAELQRRAGGHGAASNAIRHDVDRRLRRQVKAPPDLSAADVANLVATQAPVDPGTVQQVMLGPMASNGADLGALVADVDALDEAIRIGVGRSPESGEGSP